MKLYHFTCDHAADLIKAERMLVPNPQPVIGGAPALTWFSTHEQPDRHALGLTSQSLDCDRTKWRVTVDTDAAVPWTEWVAAHDVPWEARMALTDPLKAWREWFVADVLIPIQAIEAVGPQAAGLVR